MFYLAIHVFINNLLDHFMLLGYVFIMFCLDIHVFISNLLDHLYVYTMDSKC